jgi:hypothetical protein
VIVSTSASCQTRNYPLGFWLWVSFAVICATCLPW